MISAPPPNQKIKNSCIDLNLKWSITDKGNFILIRETINQENVAILNTHKGNSGAPNFI